MADDEHNPLTMTGDQLRRELQLSASTFFRYQRAGRYARFELVPRIGPRRYSRAKVEQYLNRDNARLQITKAG